MFKLIGNLTKAAVAVTLAPVALAVDVVRLPVSAEDGSDPFKRTSYMLKQAGRNVKDAIDD